MTHQYRNPGTVLMKGKKKKNRRTGNSIKGKRWKLNFFQLKVIFTISKRISFPISSF